MIFGAKHDGRKVYLWRFIETWSFYMAPVE
jgi:hypothetical protein